MSLCNNNYQRFSNVKRPIGQLNAALMKDREQIRRELKGQGFEEAYESYRQNSMKKIREEQKAMDALKNFATTGNIQVNSARSSRSSARGSARSSSSGIEYKICGNITVKAAKRRSSSQGSGLAALIPSRPAKPSVPGQSDDLANALKMVKRRNSFSTSSANYGGFYAEMHQMRVATAAAAAKNKQ